MKNRQKAERVEAIDALTKKAAYFFEYLYDLTHADGRDEKEIANIKKEISSIWQELNNVSEA